jgi:hypothetical protein
VLDRLHVNDLFTILDKQEKYKDLYEALVRSELLIGNFIVNPIDKKLYKYKDGQVIECIHADYVSVKAAYNDLKNKIQSKPDKGIKTYNIWQKDQLVFKIRDNDTTLGAVCGTASKKDILNSRLKELYGKEPRFAYNKPWLCFIIEILSRKQNIFQRALFINKN